MNTNLIPKRYRWMFTDIPGFENIPLDSPLGVAMMIVIKATNTYLLDALPNAEDGIKSSIWSIAARECEVLARGELVSAKG